VGNELLYRHDEARIEIVEEGRPWSLDGALPTAVALVMARTMKRVAVKHLDLDLARRANELDKEARSALTKRQSALSNSEASK